MQPLQVAEARTCLPIEPHLLAQEANEDQPHPDRSRDAGQVPADGIAVRVEQEPDQADQPDERGEEHEELGSGRLMAGGAPPPAPERPHARPGPCATREPHPATRPTGPEPVPRAPGPAAACGSPEDK